MTKPPRLAEGPRAWPGEEQAIARRWFLELLPRVAPGAVQELMSTVGPLVASFVKLDPSRWDLVEIGSGIWLPTLDPEPVFGEDHGEGAAIVPLAVETLMPTKCATSAIKEWAIGCRIDVPWVTGWAFSLLIEIAKSGSTPDFKDPPILSPAGYIPHQTPIPGHPVAIQIGAFYPSMSEAEWRRDAIEKIDNHVHWVKKRFGEVDWRLAMPPARPKPATVRHLTWLIKFAVLRQTYGKISEEDEVGVDITTVMAGIRTAAKLTGIKISQMEQAKAGRPRKSKRPC